MQRHCLEGLSLLTENGRFRIHRKRHVGGARNGRFANGQTLLNRPLRLFHLPSGVAAHRERIPSTRDFGLRLGLIRRARHA